MMHLEECCRELFSYDIVFIVFHKPKQTLVQNSCLDLSFWTYYGLIKLMFISDCLVFMAEG